MIFIFFIVFLPVILSILLYFILGGNVKCYHYLPGFHNSYLQIPEDELKYNFGKPMLMDIIKLATFASLFLFIFMLFDNVFLFLIEVVFFMFLATYFQTRANERLEVLCKEYKVTIRKRGKR